MLPTLLIVFREVVEAALIIGIVMAACRGLPQRNTWILIGVSAGLLGAGLLALGAGGLAQLAAGMGAEIFNATILLIAVAMLGWHSIWMHTHGRELGQRANALGQQVGIGAQPLYAIAVVCGVAVLREGAETVLFLYGIAASEGPDAAPAMLLGGALGIALGVLLGTVIYLGLMAIPMRRLFHVTNILILLMAAGLAAQAMGYLIQADLAPTLGQTLWDTSELLPESSALGRVLHTLVGYVDRPAGIQVLIYVLTLAIIGGAGKLVHGTHAQTARALLPLLVGAAALLAGDRPAQADFQVRSPIVEQGEIEIEHNGALVFDRHDGTKIIERSFTNSIGYGLTPWLKIELEGEWEGEAGQHTRFAATTLELTFQLTPQGQYFADFGFFLEFSKAALRGEPDVIEFGPIMQIELLPVVLTFNLFLEKQVFTNHSNALTLSGAAQALLPLHPLFQPAIEYYGEIEDLHHTGKFRDQAHRAGPALLGVADLAPGVKAKYEAAFLIPLTRAAEGNALRWKAELEFAF